MAGETLSGSLAGIVREIWKESYKYKIDNGVLKALVTPVGVGKKGSSVQEPVWDPTSRSGTAATEGTDFTGWSSYTSSTQSFTAAEWIEGTVLTYDAVDEASESTMDEHARMHGMVHAKKIETKIAAVFASFSTNTVTATSTSGLTYAKVMAAKANIKAQGLMFEAPFYLAVNDNVYYYLEQNLTNNSNYGPLGTMGDKLLDKYYAGNIGNEVQAYYSNTGITAATNTVCAMWAKDAIGLFTPRDYTFKTQENISLRGHELVSTHKAGARKRIEKAGCLVTAYGVAPS